jgi:hypothetical protein
MSAQADLPSCDQCGQPANTIHLLNDLGRVMAACPRHDPGGYWFELAELEADPTFWIEHLAMTKDPSVPRTLVRWMDERAPALSAALRQAEIQDPHALELLRPWPPAEGSDG